MKHLHSIPCLTVVCLLAAATAADAGQPAPHRCAEAASKQARALLAFHAGSGTAIDIDAEVRVLAPLRNPVNRRQMLDVLEVQGHVYRADYRLRLIYARIPGDCVLMGQEVIELSSL